MVHITKYTHLPKLPNPPQTRCDVQVSFQEIMLFLHLMPEKRSSIEANRNVATHFENFLQSALNLGPNQRTLNFFFQSALNLGPT